VSVAIARARELGFDTVACASTGNLANAVAAHAAAAGLESYVFIPPSGGAEDSGHRIYGTPGGGGAGQLRRRQPPLHRALRPSTTGAFVNINMRPYYAEDPRPSPTRRPSSSASSSPTAWWPRSPRARCSPRSLVASGSGSNFGLIEKGDLPTFNGAQATGCSPGGRARSPMGWTSASRSSRTRSPGRWRSAIRPDGPYALDLARSTGGRSTRSATTRSAEGSSCLAGRPASHRDRRGRDHSAVLAKLAERGDSRPDERVVVSTSTGEGLKTLDVARGTFETWRSEPNLESVLKRANEGGRRARIRFATMGGQRQDPNSAARGNRRASRRPASTEGQWARSSRRAVRSATGAAQPDRPRTEGCAGSSTCTSAVEDIRFLDGLDTQVEDGDEVTILPAVAGG